jgi:4-hydroxy-tetrahydrodipicolinate synthase
LPRGIVAVVQTAFRADLSLDSAATAALVRHAIAAGVDGFLVPAMASEVGFLSAAERRETIATVSAVANGRVPVILGASAATPAECAGHVRLAERLDCVATLVAVPAALYGRSAAIDEFFDEVAGKIPGPLVIQDLQFHGPGLEVAQIAALRRRLPQLAGIKIETVPAGPKYSAVREACGPDFWISGGWAVGQMIEALDRGVDAMVPESSMVSVYKAIERLHHGGCRADALALFRQLLPVLAFTNQDLATSVAFFKRLLVRMGIFASASQRLPLAGWDATSERVAAELIDHYLALEAQVSSRPARVAPPPISPAP